MKLFVKAAIGIVVIVVLALVGMRFLVPADAIREQIAAAIERETGRKLEIGGEASVGGFPGLGVSLADVRLRDPAEMGDGDTLTMDALKVDLELAPLFSRRVAIKRLVLTRPRITLRTDAQGRKNWEMRRVDNREEPRVRLPSRGKSDQPEKSLHGLLGGLALDNARIRDGEIRIVDERAGTEHLIEHATLAFTLPSLKDPLDVKGNFVWKGETIGFEGHAASVETVLDQRSTPVTLALNAKSVSAKFDGQMTAGETVTLDGSLTAKSPAMRDVLAWLGDAPKGGGFGPAELSTEIGVKPDGVTLAKLHASMDGQTVDGQAAVVTGGLKPLIRAKLRLNRLDLASYLEPREPERRTEIQHFLRAQAGDDPINDLLDRRARRKAREAASPPSEEDRDRQRADRADAPIDVRPGHQAAARPRAAKVNLAAIDADLDLTFGAIRTRRLEIGKSVVVASLKDGLVDASLKETAFYEGRGTGKVTYDARGAVPATRAELSLSGVSGLALLKDAAEFDWLSGKTDVSLLVNAQGVSAEEITASLNGNGKLTMLDGAIEGVDLPGTLRNLKQGQAGDFRRSATAKTPFSRLEGTFRIENGIARTEDLKVTGPLIRMIVDGSIDLPNGTIDMLAEPKVVAALEDQEDVESAAGIAVPFRIEGPLEHPAFRPDLKRMFSNPEQTRKTVREIGEMLRQKLKGRRAGDIFDNLLGPKDRGADDQDDSDDGSADSAEPGGNGSAYDDQDGYDERSDAAPRSRDGGREHHR